MPIVSQGRGLATRFDNEVMTDLTLRNNGQLEMGNGQWSVRFAAAG
ncbi:MAG: hypothetical protein L0Y75_03825 [Acidobacteria bacterium]|nr:hypothetical protein [Acidobacteriota bacterium]